MDDRDDHLMRCFLSAFPSANRHEIRTAKTFEAIPGCDSLRMVNLLAVLDDEFGVKIDSPEGLELEPFEAVKRRLSEHDLTAKEFDE